MTFVIPDTGVLSVTCSSSVFFPSFFTFALLGTRRRSAASHVRPQNDSFLPIFSLRPRTACGRHATLHTCCVGRLPVSAPSQENKQGGGRLGAWTVAASASFGVVNLEGGGIVVRVCGAAEADGRDLRPAVRSVNTGGGSGGGGKTPLHESSVGFYDPNPLRIYRQHKYGTPQRAVKGRRVWLAAPGSSSLSVSSSSLWLGPRNPAKKNSLFSR